MPGDLSERERTVLHYVVHDFIETASPIGSRYISRRHEDKLGLSSATIRNIMSDLEYHGYIDHPHTSAGRVPTDLGYRFYLNQLMQIEKVPEHDRESIKKNLDTANEIEEILKESSRILGSISRQLCVVTAPELSSGIFEKIELVQIISNRIMAIISIKSGLVRTMMMEVATEIRRDKLDELTRFLNERLSGLTLQQIRETFADRMRDVTHEDTGLIRLFIDSVDKLFVGPRTEKLHVGGTDKVIEQPEFMSPRDFRGIVELISNEELIIHVFQKHEDGTTTPHVTIGQENEEERMKSYSVIRATYTVGDVAGAVGVIGPTRMQYSRMIPLVDYVAKTISEMFTQPKRT
jgi:heat-inducible transcriptional repressor